jgi:hypothetical protein
VQTHYSAAHLDTPFIKIFSKASHLTHFLQSSQQFPTIFLSPQNLAQTVLIVSDHAVSACQESIEAFYKQKFD